MALATNSMHGFYMVGSIDVQMACDTMAHPQARFFGPVRVRHGLVEGSGVGCHLGTARKIATV
jgi:hypothetical protein